MRQKQKRDPRVLKQHNNVPGAVNGRRQLIAEERHYFTSSKEVANLLVNRHGCTIVLKMDGLMNREDWQYLLRHAVPLLHAPHNRDD